MNRLHLEMCTGLFYEDGETIFIVHTNSSVAGDCPNGLYVPGTYLLYLLYYK